MLVTEKLSSSFSLDVSPSQDAIQQALIVVPAGIVYNLYKHFALTQQHTISAYGFHRRQLPFDYIDQNFRTPILKHLREFLLRYCVHGFLLQRLQELKILIAGQPRLVDITVDNDFNMLFAFELITPPRLTELKDWRFMLFRPPLRKNYKDLDKQAFNFMESETANEASYKATNGAIQAEDWVCFDVNLVDEQHQSVLAHAERFWLKISDEEDALPHRELFVGRRIGERFYSLAPCLQELFNHNINTRYQFAVTIVDTVPHSYFAIDTFQRHFRLKTKKKAHQKLIEVFSSKNDLSLHRNIVEELFTVCYKYHEVIAPLPAIAAQQQELMRTLIDSADYPVYRMQSGFEQQVRELAEKQVREMIMMDALAYYEELKLQHEDVKSYLNLALRPRTKEFIHFKHPVIIANTQEWPTPDAELKQLCLREKMLNYAIAYLSER